MNQLAMLIELSEKIGRDRLLAPGTSGNTSIKDGNVLWIKPSGANLADAARQWDFVPVLIRESRGRFLEGDLPAVFRLIRGRPSPSPETFMHLFIPRRVVIHVHAINTVVWSVMMDGARGAGERLAGLPWTWIPYAQTGRDLALSVISAVQKSTPDVFILANHGLTIAADSVAEAEALLWEVETRLQLERQALREPAIEALDEKIDRAGWAVPEEKVVHQMAMAGSFLDRAPDRHLYPCQAVYLGRRIGVIDGGMKVSEAIYRHARQYGLHPVALRSAGEGVLWNINMDREERDQLEFLAEAGVRIRPEQQLRYLSQAEIFRVNTAIRKPAQRRGLERTA